MSKESSSRIRLIYGIAQSVSIIAAAICLMTACVSIYRQGDHPFSREAVAAAFGPISGVIYLCLALVLGGFLLDLPLPADTAKKKLRRVKTSCRNSQALPEGKRLSIVRTVVIVLGAACLVYGFFTGGTVDVLTKAVNICTECVGLG